MEKTDKKPALGKYYEAIGRRKTAGARVRLFTASGGAKGKEIDILVNEKPYGEYFHTAVLKKISEDALTAVALLHAYRVTAKIKGGGIHAQAEALRHGISRALLKIDPDFRKVLKSRGYLKRDPRMKERRKFGLKKARKAPQWAKR